MAARFPKSACGKSGWIGTDKRACVRRTPRQIAEETPSLAPRRFLSLTALPTSNPAWLAPYGVRGHGRPLHIVENLDSVARHLPEGDLGTMAPESGQFSGWRVIQALLCKSRYCMLAVPSGRRVLRIELGLPPVQSPTQRQKKKLRMGYTKRP